MAQIVTSLNSGDSVDPSFRAVYFGCKADIWLFYCFSIFKKIFASPQQIGSGEFDDLVGTPVKNGLEHVERKTLRHLRSYFRGHRQLHAVDDRIDEHRTGMSQGLGELLLHLRRILDAHALDADGLSHGREVRIDKLGSGVEKAGRLLFELDEAERTIVEHDYLHRELELRQAKKIAHQHGESTVAGQRDHLALRESGLSANGLRHRIRHRAVPERADQTTPAVHGEITRRPHGRQADVAGEDGVVACELARPPRNQLGRQRPPGSPPREIVEPLARLGVVFQRGIEMAPIALGDETRQQPAQGGANLADQTKLDWSPATDR